MDNTTKTTHPMILIAAGAITIASLAAAAHFTGLLPTQSSEPAPVVATTTAPAAAPVATPAPAAEPAPAAQPAPAPKAAAVAPAPKPRVQQRAVESQRQAQPSDDGWRQDSGNRRVSTNDAGIDVIPASRAPAAPPACRDCGTVESVREVAAAGEGSGMGAIAGGVLGGVLGNQVGRGTGKDLATIAGAVGGAFAGHQVEKNVRSKKQYEVSVRLDDGTVRSFTEASGNWQVGARVRVANGSLQPN